MVALLIIGHTGLKDLKMAVTFLFVMGFYQVCATMLGSTVCLDSLRPSQHFFTRGDGSSWVEPVLSRG